MTRQLRYGETCHDCEVAVEEAHEPGCALALCLWTGRPRTQCDPDQPGGPSHDCGEDAWTGYWPGEQDCARLGLWSVRGEDIGTEGWVPIEVGDADAFEAEHPGVELHPDVRRLRMWGRWDVLAGRWERRVGDLGDRAPGWQRIYKADPSTHPPQGEVVLVGLGEPFDDHPRSIYGVASLAVDEDISDLKLLPTEDLLVLTRPQFRDLEDWECLWWHPVPPLVAGWVPLGDGRRP